MSYESSSTSSASVSPGVQQAIQIVTVNVLEPSRGIHCYSPASVRQSGERVPLNIGDYSSKHIRYMLYDIAGKQLRCTHVNGSRTIIDTDQLSSSAYLLRVIDGKQELASFKIIKK